MKSVFVRGLVVALATVAAVVPAASNAALLFSCTDGFPAKATPPGAPQLAGLQIFFRGQPAQQIISSNKVKKYRLELTGSGFAQGATVIVDTLQAYPYILNNPRQAVAATVNSATSLSVAFLPGSPPPPGVLKVKVVNPDGAESNTLSFDAISNPVDLSITSISPESGPIGGQVTIRGLGLIPVTESRRMAFRFTPVAGDIGSPSFDPNSTFLGFYPNLQQDGGTASFIVPNNTIAPLCAKADFGCDPFASILTTVQQYRVQIINQNGLSNSLIFQVTPATSR